MTTTADKIKELEEALDKVRRDLVGLRYELIENPPNPEPLLCWAMLHEDDLYTNMGMLFSTKEGAVRLAKPSNRIIQVCEVTPQMEQDEKDARRYRYLRGSLSGQQSIAVGTARVWGGLSLDEEIDKALES